MSTNPLAIWSSSKKDWSDWSTVPAWTFPAQEEQAPARQEYGRSIPANKKPIHVVIHSTRMAYHGTMGLQGDGVAPRLLHDLKRGRHHPSDAKSRHTCFLGGIENIHIISALDDLISGWSLQGDLIGHHLQAAGSAGLQ